MTRTTRRVLLSAFALLALLGWLGFRSFQVYRHLDAARGILTAVPTTLGSDTGQRLSAQARTASQEVRAAKSAADDPVFWLAAHVPVLGNSFALARGAATVSERVVDQVLVPSAAAATDFQRGKLLQNGRINLSLLSSFQEPLRRAAASSAQARAGAEDLPVSFVPQRLVTLRRQLVEQADRLDRGIAAASKAVALAPDMLGANGPRRYFLAIQNNAESRGTGGLIGAYAVVVADQGKLTREKVGTDGDLKPALKPVLNLGAEYAAHYDQYLSRLDWRAAVLTPDWPSAAATMAALWTAQSRQKVDAVLGLDPRGMAAILSVTGPIEAASQSIGSGNVADFIMRDEYSVFATKPQQRKVVLGQLAAGMFDKVVSGQGSTSTLVQAMTKATREGRLQLWSRYPAEEALLKSSTISGQLPNAASSLQVVSNNAAASKLDYYVRRSVVYVRPRPGVAIADITFENTVIASAVPDYVKSRVDKFGFNPTIKGLDGSTSQLVTVYGGVGARIIGVRVDGVTRPVDVGIEKGHPYITTTLEISPGTPVRLDVTMTDPGGTLVYRQQPLAFDDTLDIRVPFTTVGRSDPG